MSNYCACSGGDEEYTIELNQQGPEGPQGPVGPEGFSPSISINTNTDAAYILTVTNKEGSFNTPNLYGELEKLNADLSNLPNPAYINGVILSRNEEGVPSIQLDTSKATVNTYGNLVFSTSATNEGATETFNYELVVNPTDQRLELHDNEGTVKIVATTDYIPTINVATTTTAGIVKPDGNTITVTPDGTISAVQQDLSNLATKEELASTNATVTNLQTTVASNTTSIGTLREDLSNLETTVGNNSADIAALDADKLEQSNIIAGANITIDRNGNNLTINSTGGGGGGSSIDDSTISSASTWSSSKINSIATELSNTKNDNIFDIGKFTVVGSPTITDNGIASGFSNSDFMKVNIPALSSFKTISVLGSFKTNTISSQKILTTTDKNGREAYGLLIIIDSSGYLTTQYHYTGIGWTRVTATSNAFVLSQNTNYFYKFEFTGSGYNVYVSTTGAFKGEEILYASRTDSNMLEFGYSYLSLGANIAGTFLEGSIDLKQFSITVDGEEVFNGLMESTKPIYDKLSSTSTALSTFQTDTDNNFSAVNSALNEKANLSDLSGYVTLNKYNELLNRVVALETEINGGNA